MMLSCVERWPVPGMMLAVGLLVSAMGCAGEPTPTPSPQTPGVGGTGGAGNGPARPMPPGPPGPPATDPPSPGAPDAAAPAGGGPSDGPPPLAGADANGPGSPPPRDAGPVDAPLSVPGDRTRDPFGVRKIYPSRAMGREWYLPATAERSDGEWSPARASRRTEEEGVFHIEGSPRLAVASPAGKPWWRNVEITGYFRLRGTLGGDDRAASTSSTRAASGTSPRTSTAPASTRAGRLLPARRPGRAIPSAG